MTKHPVSRGPALAGTRISRGLFAGVGFSFLLASAWAQQSNPGVNAGASGEVLKLSEFNVSTDADKGYRAGNSVSATRIDTPIKDLPFSVSAFTSQFITDIGARDLWDVVQYAPGVTSAAREFNAGNAVYNIRGFDQAPQHNGFVAEGYIDTVSIERVEVVKGPSSVLYGQVAPGGTVNYITKRPAIKRFATVNLQAGNDSFLRSSIDVNQPLIGDKLLFRLNGALENGLQYISPGKTHTEVIAPVFTYRFNERIALTVDYQWFHRDEDPPAAHLKPNIEVVERPNAATGLLPTAGILISPLDQSDPGFLSYYPLPRKFNYVSNNDYRVSDYESLNAELTAKVTEQWSARANFNWNKRRVAQKLTGLGAVTVSVPTRYYPGGPSSTPTAAEYKVAALAFAQDILKDTRVALDAPQAQLGRRKRLQEDFGYGKTSQVEMVGKYDFSGIKFKPLVGAYYNESTSYSRLRQSAAANFFPVWDIKNPSTWDQNTDFVAADQPFSTNNRGRRRNSAGYLVLNGSAFEDRLSVILGARYNKSSGSTDNFLNSATSLPKVSSNRTTPQAGLGWKIHRDMMVYASYSESYVLNAAALTFENTPIGPAKPTTSKGYEAGVKTDFLNGRISSTVAVFSIDQKDRILGFNSFNAAGVTVINTLQGTLDRSQGLEAEITYSPLDNLQIYASGSLADVRVRQVPKGEEIFLGSHPEGSSKQQANLWSRYSFTADSVKGLWIGAGFNFNGKKAQRTNNPYLFLASYTLWNSAIGYDFKWAERPVSLALNWQNMTNKEYFPANQERGLPSRIVASVTVKF